MICSSVGVLKAGAWTSVASCGQHFALPVYLRRTSGAADYVACHTFAYSLLSVYLHAILHLMYGEVDLRNLPLVSHGADGIVDVLLLVGAAGVHVGQSDSGMKVSNESVCESREWFLRNGVYSSGVKTRLETRVSCAAFRELWLRWGPPPLCGALTIAAMNVVCLPRSAMWCCQLLLFGAIRVGLHCQVCLLFEAWHGRGCVMMAIQRCGFSSGRGIQNRSSLLLATRRPLNPGQCG